jgi:para-aminobenzoate synthetase/4-amino-4-deoxychorismate lyase
MPFSPDSAHPRSRDKECRPTGRPFARFDDLRTNGSSFVLTEPSEEFCARRADEVGDVLRQAEAVARSGKWVAGYVTYEAAAGLDPRLAVTTWPAEHPLRNLPLAWFGSFSRKVSVPVPIPIMARDITPRWTFEQDQRWHRAAVERIRAAIADGSFYQVNLTVRTSALIGDPERLYAGLVDRQRAAYHALIHTNEHTVVSASPELFFAFDGDRIVTQPMKGTAPRSRDPGEDQRHAAGLRASEKERAENVMIVDLLRNDLAKIAVSGSVTVPRLLEVECYPTVWQMTSTVSARVGRDVDLLQIFAALFPSGSVTGTPKQAAMDAIAQIEARPRGVYCGAVGLLSPGEPYSARFSVAIRTAASGAGGYTVYGAGGGITYSSSAEDEWREVVTKTRVLEQCAPGCAPEPIDDPARRHPASRTVLCEAHRHALER